MNGGCSGAQHPLVRRKTTAGHLSRYAKKLLKATAAVNSKNPKKKSIQKKKQIKTIDGNHRHSRELS